MDMLFSNIKDIFLSKRKYNKIKTHLTHDEKHQLLKLSKGLEPNKIILEIGSYIGASACFLSLGAKTSGNIIYCVDTWYNDAMTEGNMDTYKIFLKNTEPFRNIIRPLRGTSSEVAA